MQYPARLVTTPLSCLLVLFLFACGPAPDEIDAGGDDDAGAVADAAPTDSGSVDAGQEGEDASMEDAGPIDGGPPGSLAAVLDVTVTVPLTATTCVAPCYVHASGRNTTDPDTDREFHALGYRFDWGDPGAGDHPAGAAAHGGRGWSRNVDTSGPAAAHVYESAGTYTIALTVSAADGDQARVTSEVTVLDPAEHYAAEDTHCFRQDSATFDGCPAAVPAANRHDLGGGANTFVEALETHCDIDESDGKLCLFFSGDTFTQNATLDLGEAGAATSLITAFDATGQIGEDAAAYRVQGSTSFTVFGGGQGQKIFSHLIYDADPDCAQLMCRIAPTLNAEDQHSAFHRVQFNGQTGGAFTTQNGSFVDDFVFGMSEVHRANDDAFGGSSSTQIFICGSRQIWMGSVIDGGNSGEFNMRRSCGITPGTDTVIAHNHFVDAGNRDEDSRNNLQFRGGDRYVVVADNYFRMMHAGLGAIRTCVHPGCHFEGTPDGELEDLVIDGNFVEASLGGDDGQFWGVLLYTGGNDITVRNNVVDARGFTAVVGLFVTAVRATTSQTGNIHVLNNSGFTDVVETRPNGTLLCNGNGLPGAGNRCRGNLGYSPNGTDLEAFNGSFTGDANTLVDAPDPYAGDMPANGSADALDFELEAGHAAIDSGPAYTIDDDHGVYFDHDGDRRPSGPTDQGAQELGGTRD